MQVGGLEGRDAEPGLSYIRGHAKSHLEVQQLPNQLHPADAKDSLDIA